MRFLTLIAVLLVLASPAFAGSKGQVVQCGIPEKPVLETDPALDFCDIYSRQLAYVEQQQEFRSLIEQRRANYVQPRNQAYSAYQKKLRNNHYSGQ